MVAALGTLHSRLSILTREPLYHFHEVSAVVAPGAAQHHAVNLSQTDGADLCVNEMLAVFFSWEIGSCCFVFCGVKRVSALGESELEKSVFFVHVLNSFVARVFNVFGSEKVHSVVINKLGGYLRGF